jgi:K+/H+ antiporter YhaU regulatory subunit KhtT
MNIDIPALPQIEQDRLRARADKFFDQTISENNQRLDSGATTIAALRREIKFIESILLARGAG